MSKFSYPTIATIAASLLLASSAFAQTATKATPTAPATKSAPAEKKEAKPRTAASLECSKQADAKGLHGKERKKFRSACKKEATSAAKAN